MQKYAFYFGLAALLSACGGAQQPAATAQQPGGAASGDIIDNTPSPDNTYPAAAMLLASLETSLQLYQGDINLPVNWQVKDFPAVSEWTLTLDGVPVYTQHISPLNQLNSLKTLSNIAAGQHTMQVSACATAELCLQSNPVTFNVVDNAPQTDLSDSVRIFSLYDLQQCMSYDAQGLKIATCSDTPEQRWIIRENNLSPAADPQLCVSVAHFSSLQRAILSPCAQTEVMHWQFTAQVFSNQGYALDVDRSNLQVIIYPQHNGLNQQWTTSPPQEQGSVDETPVTPVNPLPDQGSVDETPVTPVNPLPDTDAGVAFGSSYDAQWTFLNMPTEGNYGHYEFDVPALQNWVNSGLFLRKGQTAHITASGTWAVKAGQSYGPQGHAKATVGSCAEGSLVARQGLYFKDANITCIGSDGIFTAQRDDIVYLGAVVSNDLGESYETRINASGSVRVSIDAAEGETVPVVPAEQAADYPYTALSSGWVEILGQHVVLTLPVVTAQTDAQVIAAAVQRLDAMYEQHFALRGNTPFKGQPIRFYPDTSDAPGWMLAGNPVRMDPALVNATRSDRITQVAAEGNNGWGFAHEMGHEFNFVGGNWSYTSSVGLEAWPNIFSVHALEKLGLPERKMDCVKLKQAQIAAASVDHLQQDPWTGLCFLLEFKNRFGWEFYQRFYTAFNANPGSGWAFLRSRFSDAAGQDVNAIFDEWYLPKQ